MGEYEFRCQFVTEKKGPDRENWDLTQKIGIDRETCTQNSESLHLVYIHIYYVDSISSN